MIRYRYASCNGAVVAIESVDERMRAACSFVCFSCGGVLVARLGTQKQWHFAHQSLGACNGETYLHRAGKAVFAERYRAGGVELRYPVDRVCGRHEAVLGAKCVLGTEWRTFDLTERFTALVEEQHDGRLIPDLCLVDDRGEKIYIEIAVTHRCTPEKIASGVRIIEFLVEKEADLEVVGRGCYALGKEDRVRFYNFSPVLVEDRQQGCGRTFWVFEVFSSGKYRLGALGAEEFNGSAVYRRVYAEPIALRAAVEQAVAQGVSVQSCCCCVHADAHRRVAGAGVWCRFSGGVARSACGHYRVNK